VAWLSPHWGDVELTALQFLREKEGGGQGQNYLAKIQAG